MIFKAGDCALAHRLQERAGHQGTLAGAFGQRERVIPGVLDLILGGAGCALDDQAAFKGARGLKCELLAEPLAEGFDFRRRHSLGRRDI